MYNISKQKWTKALCLPNWYMKILPDFNKLEQLALQEPDYTKRKSLKNQAYQIVEQAFDDNIIPLATTGNNYDEERQEIDTVVIHHTANLPGMSLSRLNTIQLIRIYGKRYYNDKNLQGKPLWSGHFYNQKQVFWGYHWFIRTDGTALKLLDDNLIGWHSGNWDTNKRSIGICFDDYLKDKEPTTEALLSAKQIIRKYKRVKIIGHHDSNPKTNCPGLLFDNVWKRKLY